MQRKVFMPHTTMLQRLALIPFSYVINSFKYLYFGAPEAPVGMEHYESSFAPVDCTG